MSANAPTPADFAAPGGWAKRRPRSLSEKWWVAGGHVTTTACVLAIVLPFAPDAAVRWLAGLVTVGCLGGVFCRHMSKRRDSKRSHSPIEQRSASALAEGSPDVR